MTCTVLCVCQCLSLSLAHACPGARARPALSRHLRLLEELPADLGTAYTFTSAAHLPSHDILPTASRCRVKKGDSPPAAAVSFSLWGKRTQDVSLPQRIPLLFSPCHGCPQPSGGSARACQVSRIHFTRAHFSLFVGWGWNPQLWISFQILSHLLWFTWWTRWAAFLSFVRKHPEPHLSFFPLKDLIYYPE